MSALLTTSEAVRQPSPTCQLCYETTDSNVVLSACGHGSCNECLRKCIERDEVSGRSASSTCPFCRVVICEADVSKILGRPFQRRRAERADATEGDGRSIDDLTRRWLDANTKVCEGCGSRVEKSAGCNDIACLCGWRFCFGCGSPGRRCVCGDRRAGRRIANGVRPVRINGYVDFRRCMLRRTVGRERTKRRQQNWTEEARRWTFATPNEAASCPHSGMWLFASPKSQNCVRILVQHLGSSGVRSRREPPKYPSTRRRLEIEREAAYDKAMDLSWLFPGQHSWWDYEVQVRVQTARKEARKERTKECRRRWKCSKEKDSSVCTASGRWLFSCKHNGRCVDMLTQQLNSKMAHLQRKKQKSLRKKEGHAMWEGSERRSSLCGWNGRWLFCTANSVRMLTQQGRAAGVRSARLLARAGTEAAPRASLNVSWLFKQDVNEGVEFMRRCMKIDSFAAQRRKLAYIEVKNLARERESKLVHMLLWYCKIEVFVAGIHSVVSCGVGECHHPMIGEKKNRPRSNYQYWNPHPPWLHCLPQHS